MAWLRKPALVAFALILAGDALHWFDGFELRLQDRRAALSQHKPATDLVLVEIDAQSLHRLDTWPWPRRYHAQVIDRLRQAQARSVFYDVSFSSVSNPNDDQALEQALTQFPRGAIYLPAFVQRASSADRERVVLAKPLPRFERHATLASVDVLPDADGLVRRIRGAWMLDGNEMLSAAVAMSERPGLSSGDIVIDYGIDPSVFPRLSFADVLSGDFDPALVRGRKVVVGATAIELGDMLPVPLYRSLPGPVVQALAYQSAAHSRLRPLPAWSQVALLALLTAAMWYGFRRWDWRVNFGLAAALMVAVGALSVYLHQAFHGVLHTAPALALPGFAYLLFLFSFINRQRIALLMQSFALRRKDALMSSIVENSQDGIVTIDADGRFRSANPAALELFGLRADAVTQVRLPELLPALGEGGSVQQWLCEARHIGRQELHAKGGGGRAFQVELSVNPIAEHRDLYTVFVRDVTERVRQRRVLEFQATHDALTGLTNRFLLNERLEAETRADAPCALLIIDLDRFKEINDTLGHGVGDQLLKHVAVRLSAPLRPSMTFSRIGGDEFAVLIPAEAGAEQVQSVAEALLAQLEAPFHIAGAGLGIQASIGIARFPTDAADGAALMRHADLALYAAKRSNARICHFREPLARQNDVFMAISTGLRQAIVQSELRMFYQPKWDPAAGQVVGAEALLRWEHPKLGFVPPQHIIEVAENTPLIWPLTEWTLVRALRDVSQWRKRGFDLSVAVNLSARLLQDPDLAQRVLDCLRRERIDPRWLVLEITESGILGDPERAMANVHQLRAAAIALSIDDFGTGYSSLSYLKNLHADELKIDRSFIVGMLESRRDALIVESTVDLAHSLGLKVVAEGAENPDMIAAVSRAGCDLVQGYGVARPMAQEAFVDWLGERTVRGSSRSARAGASSPS